MLMLTSKKIVIIKLASRRENVPVVSLRGGALSFRQWHRNNLVKVIKIEYLKLKVILNAIIVLGI